MVINQYAEIKSIGYVIGPFNEKKRRLAGPDSKVHVFCTQEQHGPKQVSYPL